MIAMSENKKSIYQNILDLTRSINKAILLQTDSEPFDKKEYLQAVLEPLTTNEDIIYPIKNNRLKLVMNYFLINPQNNVKLYLTQQGVDELYDVLKDKNKHPNLQLFLDQKINPYQARDLFNKARFIDFQGTDSDLPSFGIINEKHTLTYNSEGGGFLIHFNAEATLEGEKHLKLRQKVFDILTSLANPPLNPRWIRSNILSPDQVSGRTKD